MSANPARQDQFERRFEMTSSLHRRLLRAAGLPQNAALGPVKLADLTAQLRRVFGGAAASADAAPAPSAVDALHRMKAAGLEAMARLAPELEVPAGAATSKTGMRQRRFANGAGMRPYKLFVPSPRPGRPNLVVMLHGCTQTAEDFAAGTRMNALAEAANCVVLYPEQTASANPQRCWNWFNPADQLRDQGEPSLIAGMTRDVLAEFGADPKRVFVAGLSAGAAKAAIMGAAYPELYAAVGVHSGLACGAAHDMASAFMAMRQGKPGQGHHSMPTIIFHGDKDGTVNPRNADSVAAQVSEGGAVETKEGQVPGGLSYTTTVRRNAAGTPVLEQWMVHGAGHAWSGGSSEGSFTEPRGPDASKEMLRFFLAR